MSKGYAVTVEGMYMVDGGHGRKSEKKTYKVIVNVPKYSDNTLSLIKNRLLESAIRNIDANYKTYLTHSITGVQELGEGGQSTELTGRNLTVNNMSVNQLVSYVRGKKLPVALHLYTADILKFRQAITSCEADSKKFLQAQVKLQEDYEVQKELQELNPELETEGKVSIDKEFRANCKPVRLPDEVLEVAAPSPKLKTVEDLLTDSEFIKEATESALKPKEEVAPEKDESYLTDGSESFSRDSEAPYPEDIDEELPVGGESVDDGKLAESILAGNEEKAEDLVGDL